MTFVPVLIQAPWVGSGGASLVQVSWEDAAALGPGCGRRAAPLSRAPLSVALVIHDRPGHVSWCRCRCRGEEEAKACLRQGEGALRSGAEQEASAET